MPTSSIRDQIAAKRAEAAKARSAHNSPVGTPARRGAGGSGFRSPHRGVVADELLEETNVAGQVSKARRNGA